MVLIKERYANALSFSSTAEKSGTASGDDVTNLDTVDSLLSGLSLNGVGSPGRVSGGSTTSTTRAGAVKDQFNVRELDLKLDCRMTLPLAERLYTIEYGPPAPAHDVGFNNPQPNNMAFNTSNFSPDSGSGLAVNANSAQAFMGLNLFSP